MCLDMVHSGSIFNFLVLFGFWMFFFVMFVSYVPLIPPSYSDSIGDKLGSQTHRAQVLTARWLLGSRSSADLRTVWGMGGRWAMGIFFLDCLGVSDVYTHIHRHTHIYIYKYK